MTDLRDTDRLFFDQTGLDRGQVERICREALEQPDRHAALRALRDVLPSLESDLAGLRNEGFLVLCCRLGARVLQRRLVRAVMQM